jgi:AraC-like DNA-binding protein
LLRDAAALTECAHLGLLAGRMWHLADLGLVGDVTRNAPTVGEALRTLTVYQHLNSSGGLAFLMRRAGTVDFGYAIYHPGIVSADQFYDAVLAASFNFLRELCGPGWSASEVFLPHAAPQDAEAYRRLFKVHPRFNAEFCAVRFSESWMERRVDGCDPARRRRGLRRVQRLGAAPLVDQVFRALRILLLHGTASGDDVARMLSMHRRTLNRRLKSEGTTFQRVLDEVRFEVACQLLGDSDIALDDVAATLGYAGVSPFMRTFRRWAGTTPGRWRRAAASSRIQVSEPRRRPGFDWPQVHAVAAAAD